MRYNLLLGIFLNLYSVCLYGQEGAGSIKFGAVSAGDFQLPSSSVIDSNTDAVVIADIGSTSFTGNERNWFSYVFKKHTRIKIINKKALDLATVKFFLLGRNDYKDKLTDIKGATYNLENGRLETTALTRSDLFEDKLNSYLSEYRFTMPSVKEGSIIEFTYTITSYRYYNLPSWYFQRFEYPCLHSEYQVVIPDVLRYQAVRFGLDSFSLSKTDMVYNNHYNLGQDGQIRVTSNDVKQTWVIKDVPALPAEKLMYSPIDYLDRIDFTLTQLYNGSETSGSGMTWEGVTEELLNASYFGLAIDPQGAGNLLNTVDKVTGGEKNLATSARLLFSYVRDNITCISGNGIFLSDDLYDVNKKRRGNVADVNMLLIAMLRLKGIHADPVILSTRDYGKNPPGYPNLDQMNYIICMAVLGGDTVFLDASRPYLGFDKLPLDCYNGHARIISKEGRSIYFYADDIKEQKSTTVFIYNDGGGKLSGTFEEAHGSFGSELLRKKIGKITKEQYWQELASGMPDNAEISNKAIDSLDSPDYPATIHYEFRMQETGDVVYFNPVITSGYTENPLKSEQRKYPVTFPYPVDDLYVLNMEIPEGYEVDEMPKSAKVYYNDDEGFFEYIMQKDNSRVQLRTRIKLDKAVFAAGDYQQLRNFFSFIVKKYNEPVILKKKK